jgi:hypothetical protein
MKKVEFQNNQMGALLKASTKFGEKSGSRHKWGLTNILPQTKFWSRAICGIHLCNSISRRIQIRIRKCFSVLIWGLGAIDEKTEGRKSRDTSLKHLDDFLTRLCEVPIG